MVNATSYLLTAISGYTAVIPPYSGSRPAAKSLTTSLLAISLLLGPGCVSPQKTHLWKEGVMQNLAELSAVRAPKQLSLFDPLVVLPEVVEQDIQAPADQRSGAVAVVGQVHNLLQFVNVRLSQSQCQFLNHLLHGSAPEDVSSVRLEGTQQTCESSANGTGTLTGKQKAHFDVPSVVPPPSEDYLKVTLPRSPLDHILGQGINRRDKPTLEQVKRARARESKEFLQERVLARLEQLEALEPNTSLKSDYRQAFICVSLAAKGEPQPFLNSSQTMYGVHPDKVWPRILANRKERLGREYYQFFDSNDLPRPDVRWDETVIYDLPQVQGQPIGSSVLLPEGTVNGVGPDSPSAVTASDHTAEAGTGKPTVPHPPVPVPLINKKEGLA